MLDDQNVLHQHDPEGALEVARKEYEQVLFDAPVWNKEHDGRSIKNIIVAGMGGSALEALVAKVWLGSELSIPFELIRSYTVPAYVNEHTLFIASSYSGNTEETLSALAKAEKRGAQLAILASGGKLIDEAGQYNIAEINLPDGLQPRMAMLYGLKGLVALLVNFGLVTSDRLDDLSALAPWLEEESKAWWPSIKTDDNYAKQLAHEAVGKTPVFYGGNITAAVAYKWKISWNETAKNVAFWNEYSEFDHNEFMGWTSHPIEKPFAIFDLISNLEHPQILKRFALSDALLSGKRPKAHTIHLKGETVIAQLLWGCILADYASIYTAILNNVDPTPVDLIERLKKELASPE